MSSTTWEQVPLGKLIESIAMGPFGSNLKVDSFIDTGVPVLRGQNLRGTFVDDSVTPYVSESKAASLSRSLAVPGDLVVTHRGTLGQVSMVPRDARFKRYLVSQSQLRITVDETKASPEFLSYWFSSAQGQRELLSYASQTGVPAIAQPTSNLKAMLAPIPPLSIQRAIAEVLGALDDKIAANRRVIEATRELVAALAASSPATVSFGSIARRTGKSISPREMGALDVAHFSLPAFDQGNVSYEQPDSIRSNKTRLEEPVLLISKLNPRIPRIWPIDKLPHAVSVCSTEFISFAPISGISVADLWAASLNPDFSRQLETLVTGTTGSHQRLQPDEIARVIIHDPRRLSLEQRAILMNSCRLQGELADENTVIASTRDELLPLLMSGKITVRDAELAAEEAL